VKECSKSIPRRLGQPNFINKYFVGHGLDVGGKPDPLGLYAELFTRVEGVRTWDLEDGDAQFLHGVQDDAFDFVHSSHCLEHLENPREALQHWLRVTRPGGHVVVIVPDEDLYEQGQWPSTFNRDHKWTFTMCKTRSWSPRSINVLSLVTELGPAADVAKVERLDATYRHALPRYDQTLTPVGECGIEFVLRKRPEHEVSAGGRLPAADGQPSREMRLHLNQYRNDRAALRDANHALPPFSDDRSIDS
jgi:SAM-dependent methyltransferase